MLVLPVCCGADKSNRVDEFLAYIADGEYHALEEVAERVGVTPKKALRLARFLSEYGFIKLEGGGRRVKIDATTKKILDGT
ncbi:MAG: hypothetical protein FJZ49_06335 [Candidatus Verstraetearchaeota archaeon]|nr:hypothetical protein [Candidatus Verstraetearchaeota archaeon]